MTKLTKLGRYEIIREIGRGGMATVYLARDPVFERDVALKLLPREFLHDPSFIARFEREAKTIANIEHSAIVPVYDFGEEDGQPFLVLRYMPGGSLADRLKRELLSIEEAEKIITRLAGALNEAHQRGMIHRDIKPGNVLFDQYGDAFLTDFGIVKLTQETSTYTGGAIVGTPTYMSPEQARGDKDIDARSDVYALGAMVFEMLTGRPPYISETFTGLAIKHINEPVPSILALQPDLPKGLDNFIQRAMSKFRTNRYDSPLELSNALKDILKNPHETDAVEPVLSATIAHDTENEDESMVMEEPKPSELDKSEPPDEIKDPEVEFEPTGFNESEEKEIEEQPVKLPKWVVPAVGIISIVLLLGVLIPKIIQPTDPESSATSVALGVSSSATPPSPQATPLPLPSPTASLPPVIGPDPSPLVGAFYYPWYGTPDQDGGWRHWNEPTFDPPLDISSDYYPLLGPYSSMDPAVVAQHFAWLRQAGVGFIISSWWGEGTPEDEALPLLLEMGERYGIRVAFQIEPYEGRTPEQLVADVQYLYENYGEYPAFYRTAKGSLWVPDDRQKGLFFLRNTPAGYQEQSENSKYWREAIDAIHELPDGGIVLTDSPYPLWISLSHFDGIYSYNSLDQDFDYALNIRMDAWYVPAVTPGFSMERIGHPEGLNLPRDNGETYKAQWHAAFHTITKPDMVTITSFNGWHEGTQIEPAISGFETDEGLVYEDYESLEPEVYLSITSEYVNIFQSNEWPPVYRVQIHMKTSSDWTIFQLVEGGRMARRKQHFVSKEATRGGFHIDQGFLYQEIDRAQAGGIVELIVDIQITDLNPEGSLVFEIERGHEGWTEVQLMNFITDEPILIGTYLWAGVNDSSRNAIEFEVPASLITESPS